MEKRVKGEGRTGRKIEAIRAPRHRSGIRCQVEGFPYRRDQLGPVYANGHRRLLTQAVKKLLSQVKAQLLFH